MQSLRRCIFLTFFAVFSAMAAHGADVVIKPAVDGFVALERNDVILTCQIPPNESSDSKGIAGGFLLHIDDLRGARILGDPPDVPGIQWQWVLIGPDSGTQINLVPAYERWLGSEYIDGGTKAVFQNAWVSPDDGDAQILETVAIDIHPRHSQIRIIDLEIRLMNVSGSSISLAGGPAGSGIRASIAPTLPITGYSAFEKKSITPSKQAHWTPWISFNYQDERRSTYSSLSLFQHPENPGTSGPNMSISEAGELGVTLGAGKSRVLVTGESVGLRYRVFLDNREVNAFNLEQAFGEFTASASLLE